jgi:hypothetical protein
VTTAIFITGCGGGSSSSSGTTAAGEGGLPGQAHEEEEKKRIENNVSEFTELFGSEDMKEACRLVSVQTIPYKQCVSIYGGGGSKFERSFLTAKIEKVVLTDETEATVALSNGQILRMKEFGGVRGEGGGNWLVADFGGEGNTTE